eukprot:10228743-Ditylum_brightwellii.AAC.1
MEEQCTWKGNTADLIALEIFSSNMSCLDFCQHQFTVKLVHEMSPCLGKPFAASPSKVCPVCKKHKEMFRHMILCEHNAEKWSEFQDVLANIF